MPVDPTTVARRFLTASIDRPEALVRIVQAAMRDALEAQGAEVQLHTHMGVLHRGRGATLHWSVDLASTPRNIPMFRLTGLGDWGKGPFDAKFELSWKLDTTFAEMARTILAVVGSPGDRG